MNYTEMPVVSRLKKTAAQAVKKGNIEKSMAAISVAAEILYHTNQIYLDRELEDMALELAKKALPDPPAAEKDKEEIHRVLFYDGYGFDGRGLVLVLMKALAEAGFQVTYVTVGHARGQQPRLSAAVQGKDVEWVYLPTEKGRLASLLALDQAFRDHRPQAAFFYTLPYDVEGTMVFDRWEGRVIRYQMDLTDHAFWLGRYALDYCISGREIAASVEVHYRDIPKERILTLPFCSPVDKTIPFEGFPFPTEGRKVIFSGGDLYKTLGDPELTYYRMVRELLKNHPDTIFLYAGRGDDSELKKVAQEYPDRVYHIPERKDLFQVLRACTIYLNTYPMFGGMMMNYAALAGRPPLTLKHDHEADGMLFNQDKLNVEFDTPEELLKEADRLLTDPDYRAGREQVMVDSVITWERYVQQLKQLVQTQTTDFHLDAPYADTSRFRKEYLERLDLNNDVYKPFAYRKNLSLLPDFPAEWIKGFIYKKKK